MAKAEILRLIYQGRFLHSNVTLGALGLPTGKTTVMHLVPRENLPEPNSQGVLNISINSYRISITFIFQFVEYFPLSFHNYCFICMFQFKVRNSLRRKLFMLWCLLRKRGRVVDDHTFSCTIAEVEDKNNYYSFTINIVVFILLG